MTPSERIRSSGQYRKAEPCGQPDPEQRGRFWVCSCGLKQGSAYRFCAREWCRRPRIYPINLPLERRER